VHAQAAKYTHAQREAIASAYEEPGVTARQVVELARAGALTHPSGATLGSFTTTPSTVRSEARRARLRRQREAASTPTAELPARGAVERLCDRLADAIDAELTRIEIEHADGRSVSWEAIRQAGRAIREFTWLAIATDDPRPQAPGAKRNGHRQGSETRGGLAGQILRASQEHTSLSA
jgi:hypothetical protein